MKVGSFPSLKDSRQVEISPAFKGLGEGNYDSMNGTSQSKEFFLIRH